jgi:hypothetical protein
MSKIITLDQIVTMTKQDWIDKGIELFGPDPMNWKFVCPVCGNVQSPADFQQYKEKGATPESATNECIGRYAGAKSTHLTGKAQPCDYAGYGFFKLSPIRVVDETGQEVHSFGFFEEEKGAEDVSVKED